MTWDALVVPPLGASEHSDLSRPWARRLELLWIVVCFTLVVLLAVGAFSQASWYPLLMAVFFLVSGARSARRLQR